MFLLKVRATSGSPVGLRSAGKGTMVEFNRFLALQIYEGYVKLYLHFIPSNFT